MRTKTRTQSVRSLSFMSVLLDEIEIESSGAYTVIYSYFIGTRGLKI
jgi:hypothetical protein